MTPKMFWIWAVSFVLLLVVGFGTTFGIMAAIPKRYGVQINYDNVQTIYYMNDGHQKLLWNKSEPNHAEVMHNILDKMEKSRKTNRLAHMFRGSPKQYEVTGNTTRTNIDSTFKSTYAQNGLMIWFYDAQYYVVSNSRYAYEIHEGNGKDVLDAKGVWGIFIPLDNTDNTFAVQTWYLATAKENPKVTNTTYVSINNLLTFRANYSKLWDYVGGLGDVQP